MHFNFSRHLAGKSLSLSLSFGPFTPFSDAEMCRIPLICPEELTLLSHQFSHSGSEKMAATTGTSGHKIRTGGGEGGGGGGGGGGRGDSSDCAR